MIVFEDESIVVCIKQRGLISEKGTGGNKSILTLLEEKCGGEIFPVHRLDKPVGGLMVFAKTSKAAASLSAQMQNGKFEKSYLALAQGTLAQKSAKLEDLLFRDRKANKTYVVKRKRAGVKEAALIYDTVDSLACDGEKCSVLKVRLLTGRSHQIRVQFASRKHPLVGDRRYGSGFKHEPLELWSFELKFEHPETKKQMTFSALPSDEYLLSSCDLSKI